MKVLMLSEPSYPRHPGGAGKCTHVLAAGLARRGHGVHILCESKEGTEAETIDGVRVHRVPLAAPVGSSRAAREKVFADRMLAYLERELPVSDFDVVHDSGGFLSFFYRVAYRLRAEHGIPVVLHFRYLISRHRAATHTGGRFNAFGAGLLGFESWIEELTQAFPVRFADAIVCPSRQDAKFVDEAFTTTGRTYVVPDPVDLRSYPPRDPEARPPSFAPAGTQLVLFGGRIDSDLKGGDTVVDAMRRLRRHNPNVRLVLLGKTEQDFKPFQRRLGKTVLPLPWVRESADFAEILRAVGLVVVPSRYESFGMMCAEALATGTPVIASPAGGMADMITHGENGYLLSADDPRSWGEELAAYAELVLSDASVARAVGQRARAYAEARLAVEQVAPLVEDVYLAARERARRATGNGLHVPRLSDADRARYLALLDRLHPVEGRAAGEAYLDEWSSAADQRCLSCTHRSVGRAAKQLVASRGWRSRASSVVRRRNGRVSVKEAVEQNCPLALLQKDYLMRMLYGDDYEL